MVTSGLQHNMIVKWDCKIQAFLYPYPPDFVINVANSEARAKEYLGILNLDKTLPEWVKDAHALAFGLDVPALVRKKEFENLFVQKSCLIHPLSGKRSEISLKIDAQAAEVAIKNALQAIQKEYLSDTPTNQGYRKAFLALWRLLPRLIQEKEQEAPDPKLGPLWEIVPAHPAVPDHSIWDHAATASAFAGTYNAEAQEFQPALLIFTLASPQDFLAAARRTQDLWMGSFLYSFLVWQAIKPIVDKIGPDAIIYPSLHGQPLVDRWLFYEIEIKHPVIEENATDIERLKIANFPNLFTAIVPENMAKDLANEAKEKLHKLKSSIAEAAKSYVEEMVKDICQKSSLGSLDEWNDIWTRQIENFLGFHIFWVVYPWRASNGGKRFEDVKQDYERLLGPANEALVKLYEAVRTADPQAETNLGLAYPLLSILAGRFLASRKNLRHFSSVAEPGHKCTQCGIREALHPFGKTKEDIYPHLREFWEKLRRAETEGKKLAGRIRRGDRLCAVCLAKRLAWEAFFLEKERNEGGFKDVKEKLEKERKLPAHLLFPSTASIATAKFKEKVLKELEKNAEAELWQALKEYVNATIGVLGAYNVPGSYFYPSAAIPKLEKLAKTILEANSNKQEILNLFLRLDGDWLYPESFELEGFKREYGEPKGDLEKAQKALEAFLKAAERVGIPRPQHYFSLLAMDADHIGRWLSGEKAPKLGEIFHPYLKERLGEHENLLNLQRPLGPTHHRSLSASLKNFALEIVRSIVEEKYCGRLIYAGGDDVLALLPIEDILGAMNDLRNIFTGRAKEVDLGDGRTISCDGLAQITGPEERWLLLPAGMSISAGAVIAHETHPFYHVVEESRAVLKEAKDRYGRDAWAIYVLKRSGEPIRTGGKWEYSGLEVLKELQVVVELFGKKKGLSPRFLYEMGRISRGMGVLGVEAMEAELERLLRRRESLSPEDHERLQKLGIPKWFSQIWTPCEEKKEQGENKTRWDMVLDWLKLAYFIARGARR